MMGAVRRYIDVGRVARQALEPNSKEWSQCSGGRGFRSRYCPDTTFSRAAASGSFLLFVALALATGTAVPLIPKGIDMYNLSGSYSFHASFGHPAVQASGDLDLDWLGDISGEAVAVSHLPGGKSVRKCNLLISGDYTLAPGSGGYDAKLIFTPVEPTCAIDHGKQRTLRARIMRRNGRGDLNLIELSPSEDRLFGTATLLSPGPFWSVTRLQPGHRRGMPS